MISFRLATLCDLIDMISFGLSPLIWLYHGSSFDWLPHLYYEFWFTESPILQHLKAPFEQSTFLNYFKSLPNDLAPLCNTSNFLYWKLWVSTIPSLVSPIFQWFYKSIFLLISYTRKLKYCYLIYCKKKYWNCHERIL